MSHASAFIRLMNKEDAWFINASVAQSVEREHGKLEVPSSILG